MTLPRLSQLSLHAVGTFLDQLTLEQLTPEDRARNMVTLLRCFDNNPNRMVKTQEEIERFLVEGNQYKSEIEGKLKYPLEKEVGDILDDVTSKLELEAYLLELNIPDNEPTYVFGDLHGQYHHLLQWFGQHYDLDPENVLANNTHLIFMGDYVDRGPMQLHTILLLFAYKILFPKNIHLLRGNHEVPDVFTRNSFDNFYFIRSLKKIYNYNDQSNLIHDFSSAFAQLPIAAVINSKAFIVHGGLPIQKNDDGNFELVDVATLGQQKKPSAKKAEGVTRNLLWSDPDPDLEDNAPFGENERDPTSIATFSKHALDTFLKTNNLDILIRAHQVPETIKDIQPFGERTPCFTVFSAPFYMDTECNIAYVLRLLPFDEQGKMTVMNLNDPLNVKNVECPQRR